MKLDELKAKATSLKEKVEDRWDAFMESRTQQVIAAAVMGAIVGIAICYSA